MALDVDGYAVLEAIARAPDAFPDLRAEVAKTARTLVVKQLKAKGLTVDGLRRVHASLGGESFALVVDGLSEADARSLVTRIDKHYPEVKTVPQDALRRHLAALGSGETAPASKSAKTKGADAAKAAPKAPKVGRALGSPAFAATWDGKDHDARESGGQESADQESAGHEPAVNEAARQPAAKAAGAKPARSTRTRK